MTPTCTRPGRLAALLGLGRHHNGVDVASAARPSGCSQAGAGRPPPRAARTAGRRGRRARHPVAVLARRLARGEPVPAGDPGAAWGGSTAVSTTDILDELEWRGLVAQSTDRTRCAATSPASRSTAGSTRRRPACMPATSCRCSRCVASSRPARGRSSSPAAPPG